MVIEGGFHDFVGSKPAGFSDGEFGVGVHSLDDAECDLALRGEPVREQGAVSAQRLGEALHWVQT